MYFVNIVCMRDKVDRKPKVASMKHFYITFKYQWHHRRQKRIDWIKKFTYVKDVWKQIENNDYSPGKLRIKSCFLMEKRSDKLYHYQR